ncbi:uncharacterized protein LOC129265245 [Lytechinus pictus]|uniref:uncharacterized protein LOC129265245 n=1 Tax=Lytechinus pictus TaxID=7653 RepID=UPI0030B9C30B
MAASGSSLSQFPSVHHHLKVEHHERDRDSPSSVMTNSFMHSSNCMADTPSSALVEPDPHSLLSSSLTVPQSSLTVSDHESTIDSLNDDGSDLHGDDFSSQLGCGDESDTLDALSSLALQQSSLFLVNLPTRAQAPLGSLGGATTSFMPLLVIGGGMQKGGEGAQFLRLRDIAHANLICATQESIARTYNAPTPKQVEKREHKCEQCGRIFKSSSHFRYHMETHKGNKLLKCPVNGCNRSFSWPANLKYHVRTHANDRPYPCPSKGCGKTFFTVQALNVHSRIHTGTKPFKCTHDGCDKSFTTQGNLKNHFRTHTGERPFNCDFDGCTQKFAEMSSLKKHKLTHTGEKPYKCEICGRLFSQSASRNTHKRRHHSSLTDSKISPVLDGDSDVASEKLVSKGRGSSHTNKKSRFTIERLKRETAKSPICESITGLSSSEIPSVAAPCSSIDQEPDDISLPHSLLPGLGQDESSVASSLEKADLQDESSSEFVLSHQHSIHSMVSGSHHSHDIQESTESSHHHHHHHHHHGHLHHHANRLHDHQEVSSASGMVYNPAASQSLLQSNLDEAGPHLMGVADESNVMGVTSNHVMSVADMGVSGSHLIDVSDSHVMGVTDSHDVIGVSDGHVIGVSDGHVIGVSDSHVMGVSDSHVMGVSDSPVMGVSDSHVIGVSDSHVIGVSDSHVIGVSDSHVIGVSDSHVMGVSDSDHVIGVSDDPPSVSEGLQYPEDIWGGQEHMGENIMECT